MPESHLAACELCGKDGCRTEGRGGEGVNGTDLVLYVSTVQSRYNHVFNYAVRLCVDLIWFLRLCQQSSATLAHASHCQQEARLDRPIAAHVNICPGGLEEGKDGASSLVSTAFSLSCSLSFLAGWEHQARADACSWILSPAVWVFQKQPRRTEDCKGCSWASSSAQQVSAWKNVLNEQYTLAAS